MLEKMLTPLLIVREVGTLGGKTRLQKLACLVQAHLAERGIPTGFVFKPYYYGPFSFDLAATVEELVRQGLLVEQPHLTQRGNVAYNYWLTDSGRTLLEGFLGHEARLLETAQEVETVVRESAWLPLDLLVQKAKEAYREMDSSYATP